MNKSELINEMAKSSELNKKTSKVVLNSILKAITKSLSEGDQVPLTGFGTFILSYHPAKEGRNPKTGDKLLIEGANKVQFKSSKALKEALTKTIHKEQ